MASNLLPFTPSAIRAALSDSNKTDPKHRRNSSSSSSSNWWTPLFGWSSEPDYIPDGPVPQRKVLVPESDSSPKQAQGRSGRFVRGCFTEEKARRLRMMTSDTSAFHDTMYHSAIATRLASDFGSCGADHDTCYTARKLHKHLDGFASGGPHESKFLGKLYTFTSPEKAQNQQMQRLGFHDIE